MNHFFKQYTFTFMSNMFIRSMCVSTLVFSSSLIAETSVIQSSEQLEVSKPVSIKASQTSEKQSDAAAQNLVNRLSLMNALSGSFEQTIYDQSGEELQTTQGEFALERPGNLWWETAPPFDQLVVSNGEKLWVYDPDLEQVTIYPREKIQNGPASILNGSLGSIRARYDVSERLDSIQVNKQKVAGSVFTLKPKSADAENFNTVVLAFHDLSIQKVSMTDKLGQTTEIDFVGVQKNLKIDAERFVFVPPDGTDIVLDRD